jgi:hypothetical protein
LLAAIRIAEDNARVAASIPDPRSLAQEQIKSLIGQLVDREQIVSEERRLLHAQIDSLRKELVDRLRRDGDVVISGADFLDSGSAGVREPRRPSPQSGSDGVGLPEPPVPEEEPGPPAG